MPRTRWLARGRSPSSQVATQVPMRRGYRRGTTVTNACRPPSCELHSAAGTRFTAPLRSQRNSTCNSRSSSGTRLVGLVSTALASRPRHWLETNVWQATVCVPRRTHKVGICKRRFCRNSSLLRNGSAVDPAPCRGRATRRRRFRRVESRGSGRDGARRLRPACARRERGPGRARGVESRSCGAIVVWGRRTDASTRTASAFQGMGWSSTIRPAFS